jgi:nucleoside-diphosphate-sugar epimerase
MATALVTGGAGFIGSHLVDKLIDLEYTVVSVDNESAESNDKFYWRSDTINYTSDVTNWEIIDHICTRHEPDIIFHLASDARVQTSIIHPQRSCMTNYIGTCNMLEIAKKYKSRFVFSSTSSSYGKVNVPPLTEDMKPDCLTPYSVSKVASEYLCKVYNDIYGVESIVLRYFNVYGPRQPIKGVYAPVIGLFQKQQQEGIPMTIVGDGSQRRDFTYISDVIRANIKAGQCTNDNAFGEAINIGTGTNHSILQLTEMIGGPVEHLALRSGESDVTLADISKAKKLLDWEPTVTLEKGINIK